MNKHVKKAPTKFRLYLDENRVWRKAIAYQSKEIPAFRKMLSTAGDKKKVVETGSMSVNDIFSRELLLQQNEMAKLSHAIDEQQKRLVQDCNCEAEHKYDMDTLFGQDILRDRIKAVEKQYIDLKCNFMNYLSTLL